MGFADSISSAFSGANPSRDLQGAFRDIRTRSGKKKKPEEVTAQPATVVPPAPVVQPVITGQDPGHVGTLTAPGDAARAAVAQEKMAGIRQMQAQGAAALAQQPKLGALASQLGAQPHPDTIDPNQEQHAPIAQRARRATREARDRESVRAAFRASGARPVGFGHRDPDQFMTLDQMKPELRQIVFGGEPPPGSSAVVFNRSQLNNIASSLPKRQRKLFDDLMKVDVQ